MLAIVLAIFLPCVVAVLPTPDDDLMNSLKQNYSRSMEHHLEQQWSKPCNPKTVRVRKEWNAMTSAERIAYTDAVTCLQALPSLYTTDYIPGVRTHFDDFVALHLLQVKLQHNTGTFLGWHRLLVHEYERRLREECHYNGSQPYWHWPAYADDPAQNPMFSGAADSMGGNGAWVGDCIHGGPFSNMTVNLGPSTGTGAVGNRTGYDYNPRCLKRYVNPTWTVQSTTLGNVTNLLTLWSDYASFDNAIEYPFNEPGLESVHFGGHLGFGTEPMSDVATSPGDPMFYLHHASVDRMWAMWQSQDLKKRLRDIAGTHTPLNDPPSANVTLYDQINLGLLHSNITLEKVMSTVDGPFCYIYE